ncbi:unnamed protein product [Porites lobata]|uniref:Uncharacterized protein n=1 Tax=Porites lobata TaxID=104759 RepID=A0ABN8MTV3_9CNID|nr:unnamed protein product [Porites lobata]
MQMIGKVVVLFILFQALVITSGRLCHFETEISASFWIRKPCVFFFGNETKITKYIGNELRFGEDAGSKGAFRGLKVNLNEFFESPLTLWNKSCDCTEVPCLNEQQLNNLFANSLELVRKEVPTRFRYLPRLCCALQQVLGELVFRLQPEDIAKLTKIALKGINIHNWTTCVTNELRQTEWCKTFKDRCDNLIDRIKRGCDGKPRERRDIDLNMTTVCSSSSCFQDEGSVSSSSVVTLQRISLSSMVSLTAMTSSANSLKKSVQALDTNSSPTCGSQQPSLSSVLFTSSSPGSWSTKSSTAPAESRAFLRELSPSPSLSTYVTPLMAKDHEGGVVTTTFGYKAKTPPFWKFSFSLTSSTVSVSEGSPLASLSASQNTFFKISTDVSRVVDNSVDGQLHDYFFKA